MGKVIPWTDFLERRMDKAKDPFDLDFSSEKDKVVL
jgi:hypothetical protein